MVNIIGLTHGDGSKVMVNADHITHFHDCDQLTVIWLAGGENIHVRECVHEIAYMADADPEKVDPFADDEDEPPAIISIKNVILRGTLTPGETVEIQSTIEFDDGEVHNNRLKGTYGGTKHAQIDEDGLVEVHHFRDGTLNGRRHGTFYLPVHHFVN